MQRRFISGVYEVIVKNKKGLDTKNGQVLESRSAFWDFWSGKRSVVFHDSYSLIDGKKIWWAHAYEVNSKGYLTGRPGDVSIKITFTAPIGTSPLNLRAIFRLKNFIKGEYEVYKGVKDGSPYFGKARGGIQFRYTAAEIERLQIEVIEGLQKIPSNAVALGVEQLVIDLNGGIESGLLANKINATVKELYINEARWWLETNLPNWETLLKFK